MVGGIGVWWEGPSIVFGMQTRGPQILHWTGLWVTPNIAAHLANPNTCTFVALSPPAQGPTPGLLRPLRTGDTQGPGMESQPHLLSASLLSSLCIRFHICEMG